MDWAELGKSEGKAQMYGVIKLQGEKKYDKGGCIETQPVVSWARGSILQLSTGSKENGESFKEGSN